MFVFLQLAVHMYADQISCDVKVDKTQMCGKTFGSLRSFDVHMEMYHPVCCKISEEVFEWC